MLRDKTRAVLIAVVIITIAFGVRMYLNQGGQAIEYRQGGIPLLQEEGTEHSHASILIVINGVSLYLGSEAYMEKSDFGHMHDSNGFYIHKHAKGVTLVYFLKTLGIDLTLDCITTSGIKYCAEDSSPLTILVNRKPLESSLANYEIANGDKIFIDYGSSDEQTIIMGANSVPDLTTELIQDK